MSGKATTVEAITAPVQEKMTRMPNDSISQLPMNPLEPNRYKRANPVTVGGSTSGMRKIDSRTLFPGNIRLEIHLAARVPVRKTKTVAMAATLRDR